MAADGFNDASPLRNPRSDGNLAGMGKQTRRIARRIE
jgi:hypothetical protein